MILLEAKYDNSTIGSIPYNKTLSGKSSGKSCLITLLLGAAALTVLVFIAILIAAPFSKRIHFGHRVKGSVTLTLDGEPVEITELTTEGDGIGKPRIDYSGNTVTYSILGDEYEVYRFYLTVNEDLPQISFFYQHLNWWEQSDHNVMLELITNEDGSIRYNAHIDGKELGEDNKWHYGSVDKTGTAVDGLISFGYD